ncbi:TIGR03943 family putative permease subunit [uncultured Bifidobacterium sp.]|uniref:TIGR03943 family putative permease subunit n=1 Tax=uncultured Bifidobacterium sp. TaxID=165187 RepID=UPI0028DC2EF1|nr:TIGR03943 family protein [uncultured Bifidobacterium sp.]
MTTTSCACTTPRPPTEGASPRPAFADIVEAAVLAALDATLMWATASGSYSGFATPRTRPYLILACVLLGLLTLAAASGLFHATAEGLRRLLAAVAVPALLVVIPLAAAQQSSGFDSYAGGRAIAITTLDGRGLHGLDASARTLTISDDEFGDWYETIDHDPARYLGYTVTVTGFVSRDSTTGSGEFDVSRQYMSCCILDMTPFGFTARGATSKLRTHAWVTVTGVLSQGTTGSAGHQRQGLLLRVSSVASADAPSGYFYQS